MTDAPATGLGRLGRRLLAAFVLVALASVAVVTVAALIGTMRGLDAGEGQQRQAAAEAAATEAADAYAAAGGWLDADLAGVAATAEGVDANWTVRDTAGQAVAGSSIGIGMGMGAMNGAGRGGVSADVVVDGALVGSLRLGFGTPATSQGQVIAWTWILVAAVLALVIATLAALFTSRSITAPVVRLATVARAFAGGDRAVRPDPADVAAPTELGELARAFDAAAADVERSETARRRLSADVAHELRTPLAALQAGLEELEDGLVPATPERLAALHDQSLRLGRLVEDLAVLSAAETASFSMRHEPVDLSALTDEAVQAARPTFAGRDISLDSAIASDMRVVGDRDRLHQAIGNLLSNAARYCRAGDSVRVTLAPEPDATVITVADTGPGIPAAELGQVFDRMWRGSAAADVSGSGIGLAVTREIVTAHGGTVTAESDGVSGTTFRLRLPRQD